MSRAVALVSVLVLALSLLGGAAGAAPPDAGERAAENYIVVLDEGEPGSVADEHRRDHRAEVGHVYRHALRGYSARMSPTAAARVARDDRVAYVEVDREVTIAHHRCGHTGGPGGEPDGCDEPAAGDVTGTVTDADAGGGLADATVSIGENWTTTTDGDGIYTLNEVDGGEHTVTATAEGYESQSETVTVDGGATADFALSPTSDENDGDGDSDTGSDALVPWGVDRVGAPAAHGAGATGAGIRTYIVDTGIDSSHPDLDVADGFAVEQCRGGTCTADYDDDEGHGTHVAGTAGANGTDVLGVAPATDLYSVKVLDKRGSGSMSGVVAGIDWVAQHTRDNGGPAVANLSLGASGSKTGECVDGEFTGNDSLHEAICEATNVGVVFAVAAGNSGADAATSVPAAYDDAVITVSATHDADGWSSWSNWGDATASWTSHASAPVALAAPGVDITSTRLGGGTTTLSGTSMAAPHVAGGIALLLQGGNYGSGYGAFTGVRAALLDSAEPTSGWDTADNPHAEGFLDLR